MARRAVPDVDFIARRVRIRDGKGNDLGGHGGCGGQRGGDERQHDGSVKLDHVSYTPFGKLRLSALVQV
jgi:hypothetical protein